MNVDEGHPFYSSERAALILRLLGNAGIDEDGIDQSGQPYTAPIGLSMMIEDALEANASEEHLLDILETSTRGVQRNTLIELVARIAAIPSPPA